jgi:hypothetical protein
MTRLELLEESIKGSRLEHIDWNKNIYTYVYFDKAKDIYVNQNGEPFNMFLFDPEKWQHWRNTSGNTIYYTIAEYLNKLGIYKKIQVGEKHILVNLLVKCSNERNFSIKKIIRNEYTYNAYDSNILDYVFGANCEHLKKRYPEIYNKLRYLEKQKDK